MEATVGSPVNRADLSEGMNRANNLSFMFTSHHYLLNRAPEKYIFLCTVSEQTFVVSRPPILKELKINGMRLQDRPQGWSLVTGFPQPLLQPKTNVDSDELDFTPMDTRRFLTDIINPANLSLDQWAVVDPKTNFSQGQDLGARGVFWTENYKMVEAEQTIVKNGVETKNMVMIPTANPSQAEIDRATKRMTAFYQQILADARTVEVSNPKGLQDMLTPEHHIAADFFGEEHGWHAKRSRPMDCPNCGERVKAGIAFHKTDEGVLCIVDWTRAIKAGVRTKAQAIEAGIDGFSA